MGRSSYLATPPSSTFLAPRREESLPELSIGPARIQHNAVGDHNRTMSHSSHVARSDPDAYRYNAVRPAAVTESMGKPKKSKPSRKTTHSQIEKRRREKINDTMQRLKDLVPACHDQDLLLRKLDVLTATADYIEELQRKLYGRTQPHSPVSLENSSPMSPTQAQGVPPLRHSSRTLEQANYLESASASSVEEFETPQTTQSQDLSRSSTEKMEVEEVNAAESLLHIAENPMLRPVVERNRLSISELMCL